MDIIIYNLYYKKTQFRIVDDTFRETVDFVQEYTTQISCLNLTFLSSVSRVLVKT